MDNPDRSWEYLGRNDPYYGVLTSPEYHAWNMDPARREAFFQSGEAHLRQVMDTIHAHLAPGFAPAKGLDFGCGVGRVLIPLAGVCREVVGVDVSPSMLAEAERNCAQREIHNARFYPSDDRLSALGEEQFDLLHSFIVFQHIPPARGMQIFARLAELLAEGGVGVVQLTCAWHGPLLNKFALWGRKNIPFLNGLLNLARKKPFSYPNMQMNLYDLNRIFEVLRQENCRRIHVLFSQAPTAQTNTYGVVLFFQKNELPYW